MMRLARYSGKHSMRWSSLLDSATIQRSKHFPRTCDFAYPEASLVKQRDRLQKSLIAHQTTYGELHLQFEQHCPSWAFLPFEPQVWKQRDPPNKGKSWPMYWLRTGLGISYRKLGKIKQAEWWLLSLRPEAERDFGATSIEVFDNLMHLALLHLGQNNWEEAEPVFSRSQTSWGGSAGSGRPPSGQDLQLSLDSLIHTRL